MEEEVLTPPTEGETVDTKPIDPAAYEQIKNDMHKYKRESQEAQKRQEEYESKLKDIETKQLQSTGKYKELYESTVNERDTFKSKYESTLDAVLDDKKMTSVREYALKHNIRQEALDDLDMIDMSSVVVETTDQGRYNVLGADSFVDNLRALKPHWFNDNTPPKVNNGTGDFNGQEKTFTPMDLLQLQKKDPALYREIMTKKQHLIRR